VQDWPPGYAVFATRRGDSIRSDHYLCGESFLFLPSTNIDEFSGGPKKYRSAQEFQSHAIYLYFSGKPPREVEAAAIKTISHGQGKRSFQHKIDLQREATAKQPTGILSNTKAPTKSNNNKKRVSFHTFSSPLEPRKVANSTPRLTVSLTTGQVYRPVPSRDMLNRPKCRYRIGELVWCSIEPPLRGDDVWAIIDQWPGIVESYRTRKNVVTSEDIKEEIVYQVKLLALTDTFVLSQSKVTPYKAFSPSPQLLELMQTLPPLDVSNLPRTLYHFHHKVDYFAVQSLETDASEPNDSFLDASGPYSLAIQIAARLAFRWGFAHPRVEDRDQTDFTEFSALWWGAELIYVEEMVTLVCNRSQLAKHKSMIGLIEARQDDHEQGVQLLIERIEVLSTTENSGRKRTNAIGTLYEAVPSTTEAPTKGSPVQSPPPGMVWKRILPNGYEATVDVHYITCRYYEQFDELAINPPDMDNVVLAVLQGNAPGYFHAGAVPSIYSDKRSDMVRLANSEGRVDLREYWGNKG
jgi:hypothetical protein